ncbi:MAG: hypothetical protein ACP5US_07900 [Candidatus Kryptoniota bacterium]
MTKILHYWWWLFVPVILLLPFILWELKPTLPLNILVIDKTVPDLGRREHKTFFWCLKHYKVVKPNGDFYNKLVDYYGYFPEDSTASVPSDLMGVHPDLVYITDLYGIYRGESSNNPITYGPRLVYGGLKQDELKALEKFDSMGTTIIAEFNSLDYPTTLNQKIDSAFQRLLGIKYSGWYGSFFESLRDVPSWAKKMYARLYHNHWNFSGSGIVILNQGSLENSGQSILVLNEQDLGTPPLSIINRTSPVLSNTEKSTPYFYWFEMVIPDSGGQVIADYELNCKPEGLQKLHDSGLPQAFPAIITNHSFTHFYFAGDFADNNIPDVMEEISFGVRFSGFVYNIYNASDQHRFFYTLYAPLMKNIFNLVEKRSSQRKLSAQDQ